MQASLTLPIPDWIPLNAVRKIFDILGADAVRMVGGCVRNILIKGAPTDVDMATIHTPDVTMDLLTKAGVTVHPTGIDHGTVLAVLEGHAFEITTLRADVETDGRHAVVAFTTDWAVDAARRDFTMNALYMCVDGRVYDPLGTGIDDARQQVVRFIGDAATRIREDYLRILRYFRFCAWYGHGGMTGGDVAACVALKDELKTVSLERVTQEILKTLSAPQPAAVVAFMRQAGILPTVLDRDVDVAVLVSRQRPPLSKADVLARLHVISTVAAKALRLSNDQQRILQQFESYDQNLSVLALLYLYDRDVVMAMLALSGRMTDYDAALHERAPKFPISAKDVMDAFHLSPSPQVGQALQAAEMAWLASNCTMDAAGCLAAAAKARA